MRVVEIKLACGWSRCETIAPEGAGIVVTRKLTVDGRETEIDICKEHSDELDEWLAPLVADGREVEPEKPKRKKSSAPAAQSKTVDKEPGLTCQVESCGRSFSKSTGLAQHVTRTKEHKTFKTLAEYREEYPPLALTG